MSATALSLDLEKAGFEVPAANRTGRIVAWKRLGRRPVARSLEGPALATEWVMEACGPAADWGRRCQARRFPGCLLPAQYVGPYVGRSKTARGDPVALLEAGRCGGVPPVGV